MMMISLTLAYNGTSYLGWQKSSMGATIEETLSTALEKILQQEVILNAASRTDKGVHAEGQVVSCFIKKMNLERLWISLNRLLPPAIRVYKIEEKPLEFHASCSVLQKRYQYKIYHAPLSSPFLSQSHWHLYKKVSLEKMREGAAYFIGTHDFSALCNRQENPEPKNKICTLTTINIEEESADSCIIEVIGNRFLYKMVRNIVGTLVHVGQGKIAPSEVKSILSSKKRALAAICAPAHGLTLKEVYYDSAQ